MTIPTPKAKTSALNLVFYSFLYDLAKKVTSLKLQMKHEGKNLHFSATYLGSNAKIIHSRLKKRQLLWNEMLYKCLTVILIEMVHNSFKEFLIGIVKYIYLKKKNFASKMLTFKMLQILD